jgi:hypothetical protein
VDSDQPVQERCIRQLAQTVSKKLKYLLPQLQTDLYIAGTATRSTDQQDIRVNSLIYFTYWAEIEAEFLIHDLQSA